MYVLIDKKTGKDIACGDLEFLKRLQKTYIDDGRECYIEYIAQGTS